MTLCGTALEHWPPAFASSVDLSPGERASMGDHPCWGLRDEGEASTSTSPLGRGCQEGLGGRVFLVFGPVYLVSQDNRLTGSQRDREAAERDIQHQSGNGTP